MALATEPGGFGRQGIGQSPSGGWPRGQTDGGGNECPLRGDRVGTLERRVPERPSTSSNTIQIKRIYIPSNIIMIQ